jgi:hypothetical protein
MSLPGGLDEVRCFDKRCIATLHIGAKGVLTGFVLALTSSETFAWQVVGAISFPTANGTAWRFKDETGH